MNEVYDTNLQQEYGTSGAGLGLSGTSARTSSTASWCHSAAASQYEHAPSARHTAGTNSYFNII